MLAGLNPTGNNSPRPRPKWSEAPFHPLPARLRSVSGPPPPHPPPACSFPQPFESLSLHCCFRFSAILAFHSCLHWLRAAAVDALQAFVFISCPFAKLEFLSLLSTLIVFFCVVAFLHRPVFPRPFIFCFLSLLPSLQSFRTTVSCSKLAPAVRWPSLFAVGPRRTTRSV